MSTPGQPVDLNRLLWWHPGPIPDPGPAWFQNLEEEARNQLLVAELELHRAILQAQLEAADKRIAILKGAATKP
jgi:hypothetical protein